MSRPCFALVLMLAATPVLLADEGGYAIRDGDVVVFLGDSITAARSYGKIIENYTLLRYPERKVHFINAGRGGDTAAGGLERLERDVFAKGATLLTVAYGINDIGWGGKADAEHRRKYLDSIRGIVEKCRRRGVRVFICSAALTAGDVEDGGFLQKMCDEGMAISSSLGGAAIDVQRTMRGINNRIREANAHARDAKDKQTLHAPDGIHLNELGQLAMAFAILKGLGAPGEVSSATIDAAAATVLDEAGCRLSGLRGSAAGIEFDRLDEGLPLNIEPLWALQFRFIPIPDQLNRYMLSVRNLHPGRYEIIVNERPVGTFSDADLAAGVNLSSATPSGWVPGGPWDAQAHLVNKITKARDELRVTRWLSDEYLKLNPNQNAAVSELRQADAALEALQRTVARPVRYHFVLRPAPEAKPR